jgi:hypothetical protein
VEDKVDPRWRKSSYSGNGGSDCVEVGGRGGRVLVRDTKNRTGPVLAITPGAWRRFADQVKRSLAHGRPALARALSRRQRPAGVPRPPSRLGRDAVASVNHLVPPIAGAFIGSDYMDDRARLQLGAGYTVVAAFVARCTSNRSWAIDHIRKGR